MVEQLLDELRAVAARLDPIPAELDASVRASLSWRSLDAELAALTYDSVSVDRTLAGVRSSGHVRLLHFEAGDVRVDLQVTEDRDRRDLVGELDPAGPAEIEIRHPDSRQVITTDEHGRFRVDGVPAGPTSLKVQVRRGSADSTDAATVTTDWVAL